MENKTLKAHYETVHLSASYYNYSYLIFTAPIVAFFSAIVILRHRPLFGLSIPLTILWTFLCHRA